MIIQPATSESDERMVQTQIFETDFLNNMQVTNEGSDKIIILSKSISVKKVSGEIPPTFVGKMFKDRILTSFQE